MSRADFLTYSAYAAVDVAIEINNRECPQQPDCQMPEMEYRQALNQNVLKQEGNGPIDSRSIVVIADFKFDFIFEISNLNDPDINMHIGCRNHFDGL